MDIALVLIGLGMLIFLSHVLNALFDRIRIPNVLFLMLIGLVIGPLTGLVTPAAFGKIGSIFTTITLIAILFESGTSLELSSLKKSIAGATLLTVINFVVALGIGIVAGRVLLNLGWTHSLFLGAALGGTSSAVVIPMLRQLKLNEKATAVLYLESALSDVLCLIVALALLGALESGEISVLSIFADMGFSFGFAILIGIAAGIGWIILLKKGLKNLDNSMFTTFALAFILYGITEKLGMNGGICMLAFGITAGNIGKVSFFARLFPDKEEATLKNEEKNFYSEIVFILQTYFFVYIGINLQFNNLWHLIVGGIMVALFFVLRPVSAATLGKKGYDPRDKKMVHALGPKGLVAAVLASLPLQQALTLRAGLPAGADSLLVTRADALVKDGTTIQNVAYAVVLISIILSSILVGISARQPKVAVSSGQATDESPGQAMDQATDEVPGQVVDQATNDGTSLATDDATQDEPDSNNKSTQDQIL